MRDPQRFFPVNWIDGMKINKDAFIAQDNAARDALHNVAALQLSAIKYGILPPMANGADNYNVHFSLDNQFTLQVSVLACNAVTQGGIYINIPALGIAGIGSTDGNPAGSFTFSPSTGDGIYWIVLTVAPFERIPAGSPNINESPVRFPFVLPGYTVQVATDEQQYRQYASHPYALFIGKVIANGSSVYIDEDYIPPCFSISAHLDLVNLFAELDAFLGSLEACCSKIVQKIFIRSQQNELSELVRFLCDRVMLYLGSAITEMRWLLIHESPAGLFALVSGLARIIKNTIDLRIGSGKDELLNYLSEWCGLKQGELDTLFSNIALMRYDNNDINKNIEPLISFVKITGKLFETLSNLEFIGKRREAGFFVKEEQLPNNYDNGNFQQTKQRRRFFE